MSESWCSLSLAFNQVKMMLVVIFIVNVASAALIILSLIKWDGDLSYLADIFMSQEVRIGCAASSLISLLLSITMGMSKIKNQIEVFDEEFD